MQQYRTIRSLQEDLDFLGLGNKKKEINPLISSLTEDIGRNNSLYASLKTEDDNEVLNKENEQVFKKAVGKKVGKVMQTSPKSFQAIAVDFGTGRQMLDKEFSTLEAAKKAVMELLGESKLNESQSHDCVQTKEDKEAGQEFLNAMEAKGVFNKLQVKKDGKWEYIFAYSGDTGKLLTTNDASKALKGKDALEYFKKKYGNEEFRLAGNIEEAKEINKNDLAKLTARQLAQMVMDNEITDKELEKAFGEFSKKLDHIYDIVSQLEIERDSRNSEEMEEAIKVQKMHRMKASDRSKARMEYRKKRSKIKRAVKKLHKKSAWKKKHKKFQKMKHGRKAGARKRFIMAGIDSMATIAEGLNRGLVGLQEQTLGKEDLLKIFESIDGICNKFNEKISNLFEESPEEKKLGYDMTYVGKEWDDLDDYEDDDNKDLDQDFDFTTIGDDWDDLDDHDEEGDEVDDEDYEDENDKDYVGAEESIMMDMRCMAEDANSIIAKLKEGTIEESNAKEIFIGMVNHIIESSKILMTAMEEEFNYVGQDDVEDEKSQPEKPESNAGKYVGKGGDPKETTQKPESPDSNAGKYVGKGGEPKSVNTKPTAPSSNAGKYVDTKGEPEEVKNAPTKVDSNAGKYVGDKGEPDEENEKLDLEISTKGKHVGEQPFGKLIDKTVPVIESEEISLGKGNRSIPADSNMGKWMIDHMKKLEVKEDEKEDVANVLSDIWNGIKTIYVRGKAKKYSKQLIDIDSKEGSKGNASFVESENMIEAYDNIVSLSRKEYDSTLPWSIEAKNLAKKAKAKWNVNGVTFSFKTSEEATDFKKLIHSVEESENKYVGKDKPSEVNKAPVKPESNKGKYVGTKGEPDEEDEKLDSASMKGKHVGEKQVKTSKEVPVIESEELDEEQKLDPMYIEQQKLIKFLDDKFKPSLKFKSAHSIGKVVASIPNSHNYRIEVGMHSGKTKNDFTYQAFLTNTEETDMGKEVADKNELVKEMKKLLIGFGLIDIKESEELDEAKSNIETLRKIASAWHGGQFTAMYAFSSTGGVNKGLAKEALESAKEAEEQGKKRDAAALKKIAALEKKENIEEAYTADQYKKELADINKRAKAITAKHDGLSPEKGDADYEEFEKLRKEMRALQDKSSMFNYWEIEPKKGEKSESKNIPSVQMINEEVARIMGRKN